MRYVGKLGHLNYEYNKVGGSLGIGIAASILKSESDGKETDSKEADIKEKRKEQLAKNDKKGKEGEKTVTGELKDEFPEDEVLTQVTGRFKDGSKTVFDNVILDGKTKKVKGTNETKTGDANLSKPQKRYRDGESVELRGKRAKEGKGQTINVNTTPDRVTRR